MNYKLILTREHLHAITQACELFSRCCMGQVEEVGKCFERNPDFSHEKQMLLRKKLEELHIFLMGSLGSAYGIGNRKCSKSSDVCWEIKKTIDQLVSYENNPEGGSGRSFDGPFHISGIPLPEIMPTDEKADPRPHKARMADELQKVIGTNDLALAVENVKTWKAAAERLSTMYVETGVAS